MERRIFGKTGFEVSVLGFGGGPVGFLATDRQQVAEILNPLLDRGVNLIDTAAGYFGSEEAIGEAVGHRRDDYVLVSKCGQAFDDLDGEAWSAQAIEQTIDRSLQRLKTDHIDVMLLHSCDLETLKEGEALGALIAARSAGKVRFVGYSGDNEAAVYAAGLDDVAVIETSVNICDQANADGALVEAKRNNVGVLAKRPIANAAWKESSEQQGIYVDYVRTYSERLAKMGITPADLGFSGDAGVAWSEIALRFTPSMPGVTTAIVGTTKPANIERNLEIAAKGALPEPIVAEVRDAFRRAEKADAKSWLGQT
ncbi:MAG: aldo/keto reductase [Gammaproteobacteria bacterium]|jgi:aryl-alcohol dehydrogenase-like predicted oxidoreductase|nr:aldo/keto reductase [Gammaproteobacteria bacterium]MBT4494771.1 aldo/keto reductase [Gammaproteobacteria bacterium]MBT7371427.1 aldo/keto reductase [Gammaproteobacteria bacterium]